MKSARVFRGSTTALRSAPFTVTVTVVWLSGTGCLLDRVRDGPLRERPAHPHPLDAGGVQVVRGCESLDGGRRHLAGVQAVDGGPGQRALGGLRPDRRAVDAEEGQRGT